MRKHAFEGSRTPKVDIELRGENVEESRNIFSIFFDNQSQPKLLDKLLRVCKSPLHVYPYFIVDLQ